MKFTIPFLFLLAASAVPSVLGYGYAEPKTYTKTRWVNKTKSVTKTQYITRTIMFAKTTTLTRYQTVTQTIGGTGGKPSVPEEDSEDTSSGGYS
ncbi:hypothetical protein TWF281_006922 [Arthrobotrys megalospora]